MIDVELRLGFGGEAVDRLGDFADDLRQRRAGLHLGDHALAGLLLDFGKLADHLAALAGDRRRSGRRPCVSTVPRSCEVLGSAVSGQTEMHSMHWVQFSGM